MSIKPLNVQNRLCFTQVKAHTPNAENIVMERGGEDFSSAELCMDSLNIVEWAFHKFNVMPNTETLKHTN